ncbi:PAS domain-containing sensor histidine kinase [Candidatus Woesearchaeota archaeon]|nr:PAS domain-containing sensor histidine kinase [Candidatus Woesearchaeota archaeon]
MGENNLSLGAILDLVNNLPDIVYQIDENGIFTFVNENITQLGYMKEELIGEHFSTIIHPDDIEKVSLSHFLKKYRGKKIGDENSPKVFDERRTGERKTAHLELRLLHKNSEKHDLVGVISEVNASGHYFPDVNAPGRKFLGTNGTIRIKTEIHKSLEERHKFLQIMYSVGLWAEGLSGDFGNIAMVIEGNMQMLELTGELNEKQMKYLDEIKKGVDILKDLFERVKSISKGEISERRCIDVYDVAQKVFDVYELHPRYESIKKIIDFNPGEVCVLSNELSLTEIFAHLTLNSLHAIEEKGISEEDYIKLSVEDYIAMPHNLMKISQGYYKRLIFEDSGIGMSDEVKKKAFLPYFTTKEDYEKRGQGLGLTAVYNIVTMLNKGHIYVESKEGKGTSFHIFLRKGDE